MPSLRPHLLASRIGQLMVLAVAVGCAASACGGSKCPPPEAGERTWALSTTCGGGGEARVRVTDVRESKEDCASGCISMQRGRLVQLDGTLQVEGAYWSFCGEDAGALEVQLPGATDAEAVGCALDLSRLGEEQPCVRDGQQVCIARVARAD